MTSPTTDERLRLGLAFVPTQPPEALRELVQRSEAAGLDEFWVWEDCFKESGVASAAAALAWTERITVGIGLLPAPLRNVAVVAMEFANLDRMFPGRFVGGVGHGVQEWMGQVGNRARSPLTLLREYVHCLRGLLAGESVTFVGEYITLDAVKLDWPPSSPPPLGIGGTGPKSLALAGELGDWGLLSAALTDEEIAESCRILTEAAGRSLQIVPTMLVAADATGAGAQERLNVETTRWGKPAHVGIGAAGSATTIAERLRHIQSLGATSILVQPTEDEPDLPAFIDFLGREVRPLLG